MTTTILSNGSKWGGQDPDGIDKLADTLSREPLDPRFENLGNFVHTETGGLTRFFGNFANISHVFRVDTDDTTLITTLTTLIRANQATDAYQAIRAASSLTVTEKEGR